MEYVAFKQSLELLQEKARTHEKVLVSFSGGKDSWCCLDLCMKAGFKHVQPFLMYMFPGMSMDAAEIRKAEAHYPGIKVLRYPHWLLFRVLKYGVFCDGHWKKRLEMWEPKLFDLYAAICHETGISLICHGAKEADSIWRRKVYFSSYHFEPMLYPLKRWSKFDVLAYLKINNLEHVATGSAERQKKNAGGIDLTAQSLLWMHDQHHEDFERIKVMFPYIEAVVKRRDWYGIAD